MTKKRFLLALALMLTAVGGAWAQNSWQSSSSQASNTVALADVTVTFNGDWTFTNDYARGSSNGQTITIAPTADGDFTLVFGASILETKQIRMMNNDEMVYVAGTKVGAPDVTVDGSGVAFASGEGVVYALEAGVAYTFSVSATKWSLASFSFAPVPEPELLTWDAATQSGTLTTPAGNVTLSVDYYGQYRLDSIPQGWEVMVNDANWNDSLKTYTDGGNPQMRYIAAINETDSVELIPPAEMKDIIKAVRLTESVAAPAVVEPITVTWNASDITGTYGDSFTKDGVTVTCGMIDFDDKNFMNESSSTGTFTTTLGNFTRIVVTAQNNVSGTGWTGSSTAKTWEGDAASSVSFQGSIMGDMGLTIVFTIQPNN